MPYNNTPIAPSQEVSGQVSLPLARVQKIINADPERLHTSKNAAFAIALATEMFIQHLATTTHNVVKAERKPRRNIQYRDVSTAVAKTDNLEFLVDVVPKTMTFKEFKKKQEEREKAKGKAQPIAESAASGAKATAAQPPASDPTTPAPVTNGNGVAKEEQLQAHDHSNGGAVPTASFASASEPAPEAMDVDEKPEDPASEPEQDSPAKQIEMEMRGPRTNGTPQAPRRTSGFTAINGSK